MDRIAKLRALGFREEEIERFVIVSDDDLSDSMDELSEQQEDIADDYDMTDI